MISTVLLLALGATSATAAKLSNPSFSDITAGSPFEINWIDASGLVTIKLKNGPQNALNDVSTIASGVTGSSFSWTPSGSLPAGTYALEITDATGPNYSVQFPVAGGAGASVVSSGAATATGASSVLVSGVSSSLAVSSPTILSSVVSTSAISAALTTSAAVSSGPVSSAVISSDPVPSDESTPSTIETSPSRQPSSANASRTSGTESSSRATGSSAAATTTGSSFSSGGMSGNNMMQTVSKLGALFAGLYFVL